jgi:MFS transporter, NRE family, putaive nickel resistance protein
MVRVALLGVFPFIDTVWQVYALIFAINAATAFFTPAFEASISEVVGPVRYTRALSLSRVAVDLEAVGGPLVAPIISFAVWPSLRRPQSVACSGKLALACPL